MWRRKNGRAPDGISVAELAARQGRSRQAIYQRIKQGWTREELLAGARAGTRATPGEVGRGKVGRQPMVVEYNGRQVTLDELAALAKVRRNTIWRRLRNGLTVAEALDPSPRKKGPPYLGGRKRQAAYKLLVGNAERIDLWRSAARRSDMPIARWIREALDRAAKRVLAKPKRTSRRKS